MNVDVRYLLDRGNQQAGVGRPRADVSRRRQTDGGLTLDYRTGRNKMPARDVSRTRSSLRGETLVLAVELLSVAQPLLQ